MRAPRFVLGLTLTSAPLLAQCEEVRLAVHGLNASVAAALSGDVALVGLPHGPQRSQVHLFQRVSGSWLGPQVILAPTAKPGAFGASVALDGALGVVANMENDVAGTNAGAVHLIEPGPAGWGLTARLLPTEVEPYAWFGRGVAVDGMARRVAVGAPRLGSFDYGGVHVFEQLQGTWRQVALLQPDVPGASAGFGESVALDGDRMVVGQLDGTHVYVFELSSVGWVQTARLDDPYPEAGSSFGWAVDLEGDRLVVGEPRGDQGQGPASGRVHVYELTGGLWSTAAVLAPEPSNGADDFGRAVALSGGHLAVGAPSAHSWGEGQAGRIDVFALEGGVWKKASRLRAADGFAGDRLGESADLEGERVLTVRAGDSAPRSSGALVWEGAISCPGPDVGTQYCTATVLNSVGLHGTLRGLGSATVSNDQFVLQARDLPPAAPGYALVSRDTDFVVAPPGSQGTLCLGGSIGRMSVWLTTTSGAGRARFPVHLPRVPVVPRAPILAGETWRFQVWYRDWNPGATSNFTEALEVSFL